MNRALQQMANPKSGRYFSLSPKDQAALLKGVAPVMGRRAEIIEKDIWLCHVLGLLFQLPLRKRMAFKGGTSLSKVYGAIDRFSEDIDITIDYRDLMPEAPALEEIVNNSQRSKLSAALKTKMAVYIKDEVMPKLHQTLSTSFLGSLIKLEISDDAEKVRVYYPSAVEMAGGYVRPHILMEFGGRNSSLPHNSVKIDADIANYIPDLAFPTAKISVLSAERTFWEKVTLIHVECNRPNLKLNAERLSRHWYDLTKLYDHDIGKRAVLNIDLLHDVLRIKETFFRSPFSHYENCLNGKLRLIPDKEQLDALRQDYRAMVDAQMFYDKPLNFDSILDQLGRLEADLNGKLVTK